MRHFTILQVAPDIELATIYILMAFASILRVDSTLAQRYYTLISGLVTIEYIAFAHLLATFWFLVFVFAAFFAIVTGRPNHFGSLVALPLVIYVCLLAAITGQAQTGSLTGVLVVILFLYLLVKNFALQREREVSLDLLRLYIAKYGEFKPEDGMNG